MRKIIILSSVAFILGSVISPILGMAIGETRSFILGLAPEEAVLSLADEIDKNKIDISSQDELYKKQEEEIIELKAIISEQEEELEKNSKYCETCGNNVNEGSAFCNDCGNKLS